MDRGQGLSSSRALGSSGLGEGPPLSSFDEQANQSATVEELAQHDGQPLEVSARPKRLRKSRVAELPSKLPAAAVPLELPPAVLVIQMWELCSPSKEADLKKELG